MPKAKADRLSRQQEGGRSDNGTHKSVNVQMRTVTLETETTMISGKSGSKKKNKSSASSSISSDHQPIINSVSLLDGQEDGDDVYPQGGMLDGALPMAVRTLGGPDTEWKVVTKKGNKGKQKSNSFSSDHTSMDEMETPVVVKKSKETKASKSKSAEKSSPQQPLPPPPAATNESGQPAATTTDPVKRLRNLRKKLKEIESLKEKRRDTIHEQEQLDKIAREHEILEQIEQLARQVGEI